MEEIIEYAELLKINSLYKHDLQGQFICFNRILKGETNISKIYQHKKEAMDRCITAYVETRRKYLNSIKLYLD
jgi:hypothetical protein